MKEKLGVRGHMEHVARFKGVYCRESTERRNEGKPDRCFYVCYRSGGKNRWEKVGWQSEGYTAALAQGIRADRIRAMRHGEELPGKKRQEPTFGDAWKEYDRWLENGKVHSRDDRSRYRHHLKERFGKLPLSQISPFALEKMKAELANEGLAPATVRHCLVLVRQIINKALVWGLWKGENPVKKVKMPKVANLRERFLTPEDSRLLLDELDKHGAQTWAMAALSLYTGMRAGEIFALRWQHVDLENGLIHIADPKSGRARKAFITAPIAEMFRDMDRAGPEVHVFPARGGGQIQGVSAAYFRAVERLGLNDGVTDPRQRVTFHTLRHTFASWLALRGTPVLTIRDLLGHQSLAMTERYAHLSPDHKRKAAEGIEEILRMRQKKGNQSDRTAR